MAQVAFLEIEKFHNFSLADDVIRSCCKFDKKCFNYGKSHSILNLRVKISKDVVQI